MPLKIGLKRILAALEEGKEIYNFRNKIFITKNLTLIPKACVNNFMKILGYKLGQNYKLLPKNAVKNSVCIKNSGINTEYF